MQAFKWGKGLAVAAAFTMFAVPASAQDDDEGPQTQGEDAVYLSVTNVNFKPGKREGAMELITEYFVPASEKAGTPGPMLAIHYQTGKWDAAFIWVMEGGMADMEWYRSQRDLDWWAALVEVAGGEEEAGEIWGKFQDSIASSETDVGHYHTGMDEE